MLGWLHLLLRIWHSLSKLPLCWPIWRILRPYCSRVHLSNRPLLYRWSHWANSMSSWNLRVERGVFGVPAMSWGILLPRDHKWPSPLWERVLSKGIQCSNWLPSWPVHWNFGTGEPRLMQVLRVWLLLWCRIKSCSLWSRIVLWLWSISYWNKWQIMPSRTLLWRRSNLPN